MARIAEREVSLLSLAENVPMRETKYDFDIFVDTAFDLGSTILSPLVFMKTSS